MNELVNYRRTLILPKTAELQVPRSYATALNVAAERLPKHPNEAYYSVDLQTSTRRAIRTLVAREYDWLIAEIKLRVASPPYAALIRGLRFDPEHRLFIAINGAFGALVARPYEKPRAQLVHYVQPCTDIQASRGGGFESENLHTDTADWEVPVRWVSMVCVRPDNSGGGRTRLLDIDTVRAEVIKQLGGEALKRLETEPVNWKIAPYRGGGLYRRPIFSKQAICWRRYTVADNMDGVTAGQVPMAELLDAMQVLLTATPSTIELFMCAQDLLIMDNHRVLHARTPIDESQGRDRLMIRSWVTDPISPPAQTTQAQRALVDVSCT